MFGQCPPLHVLPRREGRQHRQPRVLHTAPRALHALAYYGQGLDPPGPGSLDAVHAARITAAVALDLEPTTEAGKIGRRTDVLGCHRPRVTGEERFENIRVAIGARTLEVLDSRREEVAAAPGRARWKPRRATPRQARPTLALAITSWNGTATKGAASAEDFRSAINVERTPWRGIARPLTRLPRNPRMSRRIPLVR